MVTEGAVVGLWYKTDAAGGYFRNNNRKSAVAAIGKLKRSVERWARATGGWCILVDETQVDQLSDLNYIKNRFVNL